MPESKPNQQINMESNALIEVLGSFLGRPFKCQDVAYATFYEASNEVTSQSCVKYCMQTTGKNDTCGFSIWWQKLMYGSFWY